MKTLTSFVEANPEVFRQEELILEATEMIAGVMVQAGVNTPELADKLNKPSTFVARLLTGEEELSFRALADICGAMGYRVQLYTTPIQ